MKKFIAFIMSIVMSVAVIFSSSAMAADQYGMHKNLYDAGYYKWYNTLNNMQRFMYDYSLTMLKPENIDEENKVRYTININGYVDVKNDDVWETMFAVAYDNPQLYWLSVTRVNGQAWYNKMTDTTHIYMEFFTAGSCAEVKAADKKVAEILADVKQHTDAISTNYGKVKYIHDYLCKITDYDYNSVEVKEKYYSYSPYGALIKNLCVCSGYAGAFSLLCRNSGIACNVVRCYQPNGTKHAWNTVLMDDGNWYGVDCTYDDKYHAYDKVKTPVSTECLLMGMNTVNKNYKDLNGPVLVTSDGYYSGK